MDSGLFAGLPWWSKGLYFACLGCGRCCRGEPGAIWVTKKEIINISNSPDVEEQAFQKKFLTQRWGELSLKEKQNGECIFYNTNIGGCGIYSVRPLQCRLYPFWGSILESPSCWEREAGHCPGINNGRLFEYKEIESLLNLSKKVSLSL